MTESLVHVPACLTGKARNVMKMSMNARTGRYVTLYLIQDVLILMAGTDATVTEGLKKLKENVFRVIKYNQIILLHISHISF